MKNNRVVICLSVQACFISDLNSEADVIVVCLCFQKTELVLSVFMIVKVLFS